MCPFTKYCASVQIWRTTIVIFNIRFLFITGHLVKTSTFYNADRLLFSRVNKEVIIIIIIIIIIIFFFFFKQTNFFIKIL